MNKVFTENGWADYTFWETEDRKTLKKINKLMEDICRNGNEGTGPQLEDYEKRLTILLLPKRPQ